MVPYHGQLDRVLDNVTPSALCKRPMAFPNGLMRPIESPQRHRMPPESAP